MRCADCPLLVTARLVSTRTLAEWLDWQSSLNPKSIDLGLERVRQVWDALDAPAPAANVISVAGTNGKGSSVALLEAMLRQAGYRVGVYTSPHLLRYNERIRIDGQDADDESICAAFERIEAVRGDIQLTYFEYGTLAALLLFSEASLDAAVLEVGLGGRLDAVNIIDADVALITGIALDHMDWLGDTLEKIGAEKAGIMRAGRPAVFAAPQMPHSVQAVADELGAELIRAGRDFSYQGSASSWDWTGRASRRAALPLPSMRGSIQLQNAAAVLQVLECLGGPLPVDQQAVRAGLIEAKVRGRFEIHQRNCRWILDVAHNPQAAELLSAQLADLFVPGKVHAVVGMLRDKAIAEVLAALAPRIDQWHLLDLSAEHRGAAAVELLDQLPAAERAQAECCSDTDACLRHVHEASCEDDLVLVFGSFLTVAAAMQWMDGGAAH